MDKRSNNSIAWIKLSVQLVRKPHKLKSKDGLCCTHVLDYISCQLNLIAQVEFLVQLESSALSHTHSDTQKQIQMNQQLHY